MSFAILGFIALGGAVGACARFLVSEICITLFGRGFPIGTLAVNVVGSFIMGALIACVENEWLSPYPWKQVIGLGFLGALTTFSTFSMDNVLLMQQGAFFKMGANVLLNVILSISAAWIGFHWLIKS
ncbi:fluoride efflux transporter CrcB [Vibrio cholerae]|uniref:Fluoride-specific ion channel FluC n=1 Tax=Vibrio paracholerae TaxID=650003 RepID=A0ABD7FRS9_9VIBR|nr:MULTISPECIES: fluoride efflux transporter CrcB [Vibrio]EGQ9206870.1 fluoride efflux transporter CrcB [Vibrio cholerae]EGQ9333952.1 fluoride efflux transporter CrcB [Vibrio cholerae]EIA3093053.1 fluoride efflux transporter CrcB [Vibrio cholerae]EJL6321845.1 fluoride efflux transporter CrcB [Vibrio cholerae]EJL6524860.1 fluoride efflux transporter CrcB [Vibrio cholerae]